MRVDVKKYLFIGAENDKAHFFQRAQAKGVIQFIDIEKLEKYEKSSEIERLMSALKVLRSMPPVEQEENYDIVDIPTLIEQILRCQDDIVALVEQRRTLRQEIARVEVFGAFSHDDILYIEKEGKSVVQFFFAKQGAAISAREAPGVLYVGSEHGLDYYMSVSKERRVFADGMIEMFIEKPVGILKKELLIAVRATRERERELERLACYNDLLHSTLIHKLNEHNLGKAQRYAKGVFSDKVFAVMGWVAETELSAVETLAKKMDVYIEEVGIEDDDVVPTYLENKGMNRLGEDLVNIYDAPSIIDKDPSPWVLWSFALFFAIIIGDAGYGILFLMAAVFMKLKFPTMEGAPRRAVKLVAILASSCIVWGVLTASFFSIDFDIDNPIRKISLLQVAAEKKAEYHMKHDDDVYRGYLTTFPHLATSADGYAFLKGGITKKAGGVSYAILNKFSDNIRLEIALLIGVIHIILSIMRNIRRNWAGGGWIVFMVGAYLYFPAMLHATSLIHVLGGIDMAEGAVVGEHLIWGGVGLAVVLAIAQRRLMGILEVTTVIQVFSDVLSYLRLYALGLAGSMMSSTFNDIGHSVPIVPGIIIIVIGHVVNITLSIMSGVIHGLRLNFLEWYHYSFEGGGRMLKPLSLLKKK